MKNKDKYDLKDISYKLELNNGGYDFVIYHNSIEIYREENFDIFSPSGNAFTKWLEEEYKPEILTDKEKAYLSAVIKPFREKVEYVYKICLEIDKREYLEISLENGVISFPYFEKGKMYKGMGINTFYKLEELGL